MSADVSGLQALAGFLRSAGPRAAQDARAVVNRGALNVKNGWRANAVQTAGRHARAYPYSVGYDLTATPVGASAVIGPDKGATQGPLGNLLEYGSVHNPPHNDGGRALAAEEPGFQAAVEALGGRVLR